MAVMTPAPASAATLESRLAELQMRALDPCDLGEAIEVVHDVEAVEIEMECSLDDDDADEADDEDAGSTIKFTRELIDELGTHQFVRHSAPYERIEIQLDANAFLRATIEEAKRRG